MKKIINVEDYVRMGGKIKNLNLTKTVTIYCDKYKNKKIVSINEAGLNKDQSCMRYEVNFEDKTSSTYVGMWIETEIDFILDKKYTEN